MPAAVGQDQPCGQQGNPLLAEVPVTFLFFWMPHLQRLCQALPATELVLREIAALSTPS